MEAAVPAIAGDSPEPKKGSKAHLRWEVEQFSQASAREGCLLNHRQAALILEVSSARVSELVALSKLSRFDFLGRTYVSWREVIARRESDLKAGRPTRSVAQRLVQGAKIMAQNDVNQWREDIKHPTRP